MNITAGPEDLMRQAGYTVAFWMKQAVTEAGIGEGDIESQLRFAELALKEFTLSMKLKAQDDE